MGPTRINTNFTSSRSTTIKWLLVVSIVLSLATFCLDAVYIFGSSFFYGPAPEVLTIAYAITILTLIFKQHKRESLSDTSLLAADGFKPTEQPIISKLGSIICAWLLFVAWLVMFAISTLILYFVTHTESGEPYYGHMEAWDKVFIGVYAGSVVEMCVMFFVAFTCVRERLAWMKVVKSAVTDLDTVNQP